MPRNGITRESARQAFRNIIMAEDLCDRIGVAMGSGRAIFISGAAGSGKTYIASRLIGAMPGEVLIPTRLLSQQKLFAFWILRCTSSWRLPKAIASPAGAGI